MPSPSCLGTQVDPLYSITKMVANKLDDVIRPEWVSHLCCSVSRCMPTDYHQRNEYPEGYAALAQLGKVSESNKNSRGGTPSRANGEKKPETGDKKLDATEKKPDTEKKSE